MKSQTQKKMSIGEVAQSLSCSHETVRYYANKLGFTKNGVKTLLDESQVTLILDAIKNANTNQHNLPKGLSEVSTSLTPALKIKQAMEMMQSAYEEELQILRAKQIEDAPKVEFFNQVTDSTDCIDMGTVAKVLNFKNIGRTKLFEILRNNGILMSDNRPYQKYIDAGYFRVIESKFTTPSGETHINFKTVVYQSGIDFIRKAINKQFKNNLTNSTYMKNAIEDSASKIMGVCRLASSRAESPLMLMKSYWNVCANKLEEDALNLPVTKASEIRR